MVDVKREHRRSAAAAPADGLRIDGTPAEAASLVAKQGTGPQAMGRARLLRVLILEDHLVVGLGLTAALRGLGGFEPLGVVRSVDDVVVRVADGALPSVEVVVADIDLGDGGMALDLPARLGPDGPPVVFLTGHEEPAVIRAAVLGGASGLVHKEAPISELADAVRRAAAGQTSFRQADIAAARSGPVEPSPRELEVLCGVVAGLANKEIASVMKVEERTVESHLRRMMDRYAASNRTDLAVLGLRRGWVALPRGDGR